MGLRPNRGRWSYDAFTTASAATFVGGSLVQLNGERQLSEYSGGEPSFLGIALHDSTDSLPAGKVLVALPTDGACTFWADLATGEAASDLSLGHAVGIIKSGNTVSVLTTAYTSAASNVAVIRGLPILSPVSRIELAFLHDQSVYNSSASQTIA